MQECIEIPSLCLQSVCHIHAEFSFRHILTQIVWKRITGTMTIFRTQRPLNFSKSHVFVFYSKDTTRWWRIWTLPTSVTKLRLCTFMWETKRSRSIRSFCHRSSDAKLALHDTTPRRLHEFFPEVKTLPKAFSLDKG